MSLLGLIQTGGWTMFPLLICSVAVWCVIVERFWTLRNWKEKNHQFLLSFSNHWLRGEVQEARSLSEKALQSSVSVELAELALLFLQSKQNQDPHFSSKFNRQRLLLASELKKFLWVLGTIGSAAPFIGLFGTVVGIIRSFTSMAQAGAGGFNVVAAGISEALVATAAGIIVAVIAVFFYNFFQVKVTNLQFYLKIFSEELLELETSSVVKGVSS